MRSDKKLLLVNYMELCYILLLIYTDIGCNKKHWFKYRKVKPTDTDSNYWHQPITNLDQGLGLVLTTRTSHLGLGMKVLVLVTSRTDRQASQSWGPKSRPRIFGSRVHPWITANWKFLQQWSNPPLESRDQSCYRWRQTGSGRGHADLPGWETHLSSCRENGMSWTTSRRRRGYSSRLHGRTLHPDSETSPDPPCPISDNNTTPNTCHSATVHY